ILTRIHNTVIDAPRRPDSGTETERSVPAWTSNPDLWREAINVTRAIPPVQQAFTHGDFQHFNMLWARGKLTAVLDWMSAAMGPPEIDVGHCRLNLAVLFSADWAERFRFAYESEAGRTVDPRWDLLELMVYSPDWQSFIPIQVAGQIPVDTRGMTARVE